MVPPSSRMLPVLEPRWASFDSLNNGSEAGVPVLLSYVAPSVKS